MITSKVEWFKWSLKSALLMKERDLAAALQVENVLRQHQMEQDSVLSANLARENAMQGRMLQRQEVVSKRLEFENVLMAKNQHNEKIIRWLMIIALMALSGLGLIYYLGWKRQRKANIEIKKYSTEMEYMMKEVHHRVKNNLQFIVSMLRLQGRNMSDKNAVQLLENAEARLQTIALLHEKFQLSHNFHRIVLKDYLGDILQLISHNSPEMPEGFSFEVTDHVNLVTDADTAIPIGLIVNELVTNAIKHAFTNTVDKNVSIEIAQAGKNYELIVKDNGSGCPENILRSSEGLGLKLVHLFAEQLNGSIEYKISDGSVFILRFAAR